MRHAPPAVPIPCMNCAFNRTCSFLILLLMCCAASDPGAHELGLHAAGDVFRAAGAHGNESAAGTGRRHQQMIVEGVMNGPLYVM